MLTIIIDQRAQQAYRPGISASYGLGEAGSPAVPSLSAIPSKFAGMQVSADGLSHVKKRLAEEEVGSAKKRKTATLGQLPASSPSAWLPNEPVTPQAKQPPTQQPPAPSQSQGSPGVTCPSAIPSKFAGMQVSADGLRDFEEEAGSAKRRKIAALDCSSTDDDDEITISVRAALTGEMLQPVRVNNAILGGELVDLLAREQRQDRVGTCRLLHGKMQIQRSRSLRGQGITDGSEISFVWISISAEQQRVVVSKMHAGNFISEDDMEAEDMDALNSLVALY